MKRWGVIVELPAQRDIAEARLWLAERDPDAASRWFDGIYDTIGSLEVFPERCPLDEVHILHVRHGARLALGELGLTEQ